MRARVFLAALAATIAFPASAMAQDWYVGGSIGVATQSDSSNAGETGAFNTGNGAPAVPDQTPIAAGTPYGWETEFDSGTSLSGEVGIVYGSGFRSGVELVYSSADVDTHSGVNLANGGIALDGVDAAVLTGSATQLGASVGAVVADGRGEIKNTGVFLNGYYDFNREGSFQPYVGAGIGWSSVDVTYNPSGVGIIDGDDTVFAWQLKAGVTMDMGENWQIYGEYAYRQSEDVELENQLFPGSLEIENKQNVFSIGARWKLS